MAYLASNKHGYCSLFNVKPIYEDSDLWVIPLNSIDAKYGIHLSKANIKKLIGKELTFYEKLFLHSNSII